MADDLVAHFITAWTELTADAPRALFAISGGADSMALLALAVEAGLGGVVYHLDHGLRADSAEVASWLAGLLPRLAPGFIVVGERCDVAAVAAKRGIGLEEAGRDERYCRMAALAAAHGLSHVVTAHHRDDQAETVLANVLRGAGVQGAAGIRACRSLAGGINLIRPLLTVARDELRASLRARGWPWREDASNADTAFHRNHLRHVVLPNLEAVCPGTTTALLERAGQHRRWLTVAERQLDQWWPALPPGAGCLDLSALIGADADLRALAWRRLIDHLALPATRHSVARIEDLAAGAVGRELGLGRWLLRRSATGLRWRARQRRPDPIRESLLPVPGQQRVSAGHLLVQAWAGGDLQVPPDEALLARAALCGPLHWRAPRPGERWQALGSSGSRGLLRWLGEHGVARECRQQTAVVADERGVVWVPGHTIAERVRLTDAQQAAWHVALRRDEAPASGDAG
ncbi:MAG: tRNA lysidine(34) synthetase TilS [Planctomycetota bacterium]|jgi:tRNA(Ile)-lysidine synthase